MDRTGLERRLMAVFLGELQEHAATLERTLLELEGAPVEARGDLFATLFRSAHSLKGAARSVGLREIETACHRLEEIFGWARDGLTPLEGSLFRLLLEAVDALADAGRRLRNGEELSSTSLARLLPRLVSSNPEAPLPAALASPPAAPTPPAQPEPPPEPPAPRPRAAEALVRVSSDKLDALLARSGELLVARGRAQARRQDAGSLEEAVRRWRRDGLRLRRELNLARRREAQGAPAARIAPAALSQLDRMLDGARRLERDAQLLGNRLESDRHALDQAVQSLDHEVRRARMFPFAQACEGLARVVRDIAASEEKLVQLVVQGGELELDRAILEGLRDPLLHLVRNALIHGVESPADRRAAGKPEAGRIVVAAALRDGRIAVSVEDDGAGVDHEAVRASVEEKNLPAPIGEGAVLEAIFLPGVSASRVVSDLSGRGVGLDVVKANVESMRGFVEASSEPGRGARFAMSLPLTLTTIRAVLFRAAERICAVDSAHVRKLVRVGGDELLSAEGRDVMRTEAAPLPVVELAGLLGGPPGSSPRPAKLQIMVLRAGEESAGVVVDEFLAEQEIVVRDLGPGLRVRHVSGASILPTGEAALILSGPDLVRSALAKRGARASSFRPEAAPERKKKRILLVEDSMTTRALEKSILEFAGYEVLSAVDGAEAWRLLEEQTVDLIVSDVEMPNMDGYALTEAVRASPRLRDLPIILVTSRSTDEDKARGAQAGADAYLVKSAFDQASLVRAVEQAL
jgi:two-component system chemotaxis sensor kinase CheA